MHVSKHELKPKQEVNPAIVTGSDWYKAEFESSSSDPAAGFSHSITVCLSSNNFLLIVVIQFQ